MTHWSLLLFVVGSDAPNYCDLSDQTHKQTIEFVIINSIEKTRTLNVMYICTVSFFQSRANTSSYVLAIDYNRITA